MPAELLIDLGHSRLKWGWRRGNLLDRETIAACNLEQPAPFSAVLGDNATERAWVCGQSSPMAVDWLEALARQYSLSLEWIRTGQMKLPVEPAYPGLGADRWLALQWPWRQTRSALAVIDCGSAITVDVVDGCGCHRGGWILPGLRAARQGLLARAPGLPDPPIEDRAVNAPAMDSASAVAGGALLAAIGGIQRAVDFAQAYLDSALELWITGGDAAVLGSGFDHPLRHDPHLVLAGLAMAGGSS